MNLTGDPLFQLNLLILLTWRGYPRDEIDPIFVDAGYNLFRIEKNITIPDITRRRFETANFLLGNSVSPDLILENNTLKVFLAIECKRASFGASSTTANQLRKLLSLNGKDLGRIIGKTDNHAWSSLVTYILDTGNSSLMFETLQEVATQISSLGIESAGIASLELEHTQDGIYLRKPENAPDLPNIALSSPKRVMALEIGTDPRPLYLIPYAPSSGSQPDPYAKKAFEERIRSSVGIMLGHINEQAQEYELDSVISASVQAWNVWDNNDEKQNIRAHVRVFIRNIFTELRAITGCSCTITKSTISVPAVNPETIEKVRRYLLGTSFRRASLDITGSFQYHIDD